MRMLPLLLGVLAIGVLAGEAEELKKPREEIFEFTQKPKVVVQGATLEIAFESKGYCDATVVIENAKGTIVRHLVSGVLGPNAPAPFQKNALRQTLTWDGKDDSGHYVDAASRYTARVSLGLKPQLERTLNWHPKKRNGIGRSPIIVTQPEGVYVYEGDGVEQIRMYDHEGNYSRTVYPFPADKLKNVNGLPWNTMPDGYRAPKKIGYWTNTFLTGGLARSDTGPGDSAHAFAVSNGRIAIAGDKLGRLTTDGSAAPFELYGPEINKAQLNKVELKSGIRPKCAAFSADGKYLYFTGYYNRSSPAAGLVEDTWNNGIYRMEFAKNESPALWLGTVTPGKDNGLFDIPASICTDTAGRVYVADYGNDRVQVFDADGKHLANLPVESPAVVQVHHKTGKLYVFSWALLRSNGAPAKRVRPFLRIFESLQDTRKIAEIALPFHGYSDTAWYTETENPFRAALDSWSEQPTIWMYCCGRYDGKPEHYGIEIFSLTDNKLVQKQCWQKEVIQAGQRWRSPPLARQRLYVNPQDGALFVGEGDVAYAKAFTRLERIDPVTGKCTELDLPFSAEELAFDRDGMVYLRTTEVIARYDPATWREVPFDYGDELKTRFDSDSKPGDIISGLHLPGNKPWYWHQQGMDVNAAGDIAVFCANPDAKMELRTDEKRPAVLMGGKPYTPQIYPGRNRYGELHVFDKFGKMKIEDAIKGMPRGHATQMDQDGNLYVLVFGSQLQNGKPLFEDPICTLFKFKPNTGKFISSSKKLEVPLSAENTPKGAQQISGFWVEGFEWMYSGIGFSSADPCQCWNCRVVVDFLGRSFAPENLRGQVAILDSNGNLITHVGRLGNVDDGKPQILEGGPAHPQPLGGDEVALMFANFVGTHTDRRLFIADAGNARILSVKLAYAVDETVALDKVPNSGKQ